MSDYAADVRTCQLLAFINESLDGSGFPGAAALERATAGHRSQGRIRAVTPVQGARQPLG